MFHQLVRITLSRRIEPHSRKTESGGHNDLPSRVVQFAVYGQSGA